MRKITLLIALFVCSIGFSQTTAAEGWVNPDGDTQTQRVQDSNSQTFEANHGYTSGASITLPSTDGQNVTTVTQNQRLVNDVINNNILTGVFAYDQVTSTGNRNASNTRRTLVVTSNSTRSSGVIDTYTDLGTFQANVGGTLISELFDGGPGGITACGPLINSDGDATCYAPGELEEGFDMTASNATDIIHIGSGEIGNTSILVGANTFAEFTIITFTGDPVFEVGHDVWNNSDVDTDYRVFDTGGNLIQSFTLNNAIQTENFFGIVSPLEIGHIEIDGLNASGELIGNFLFTAPGGGGGGGGACAFGNPSETITNGLGMETANGFSMADDFDVAANEDFTPETLVFEYLNFNPNMLVDVDVSFYEDAGGLPGALVTTVAGVVPGTQTIIGAAFGRDNIEATLDLSGSGVVLPGGAAGTKYWIGLQGNSSGGDVAFWTAGDTINGLESAFSADSGATWDTSTNAFGQAYGVFFDLSGDCAPVGGGGPCAFGNPSETITNGLGMETANGFSMADDFDVPADTDFTPETLVFEYLNFNPNMLVDVDVSFYEDAAGLPGTLVTTVAGVVPGTQTIIGAAFGRDNIEATLDLSGSGVVLPGGAAGTKYWIGLQGNSSGGDVAFWTAGDTINGLESAFSADSGATWATSTDAFGQAYGVFFDLSGDCATTGGGPTNDECAGATPVLCDDVIVGTTSDNTDTGGNAAADEWYSFTGTGTPQVVTVSLCDGGTDYDSLLRVFDACGGNEIATNDDSCGLQSELSFLSDGTTTYFIMVEGFGSNDGNFSMAITCIDPPPNDECAGALDIACGETVVGETNTATFDATAPVCVTGITAPGVWYTFTDDTGLITNYTLSMCDGGTDYDSKITVYSGDCGALACVVDNDDTCGLQSEVAWQGDGSTTYYILVHGFAANTGNFSLALACTPVPPPNDMIVNSIDVDEIGFPYTDPAVAMPAATTEAGNPAGCNIDGANGVWYNFVPDGDGFATATITSPAGASFVNFFTADSESATEDELTLVDFNGNQCAPQTDAIIPTTAGQAYYVFVVNTDGITDIVIDGNNLGTNDNTIEGFTYYPNPATDVLNLNSIDTIDTVAIYNILGQQVLNNDVAATSGTLDVSNLAVGAYIMKVTVNGEVGTYKIIKR